MQQPLMNVLRWLRVPGDTIFAIGAVVLGWFVLGLRTGWSLERSGAVAPGSTEVRVAGPEAKAGRA
jgi:nitric oxide reductase subunit B